MNQLSPPRMVAPRPAETEPSRPAASDEPLAKIIDRTLHAQAARLTGGLAPSALWAAYLDWAVHLALSPGQQTFLAMKAARKLSRLATYMSRCALQGPEAPACIEPLPQDRRFAAPAWQQWPFNLLSQAFLLQQQWWHNATTGIDGMTQQHSNQVEFASRQILDMMAPSNFLWTNPEVLQRTVEQNGRNLIDGWRNFIDDWQRQLAGRKPAGTEDFTVGGNLAATPGKVVYRNALIELIQYAPQTGTVRPEPVLIVPAWIMKYYILDLSQQNSLIRYLVSQGHTVFCLSWKNPDAGDRDLTMEDYRTLGVMDALAAVNAIVPQQKVHAVGYCLGGTLLLIAAAAMARDGDERLKTVTLLAAQADFTEAGELTLFINESQLSFLDDVMWQQGYLDSRQMAGAFQLLRSNDMIWSRLVHNYLMGEPRRMTDMMAWNADATRMPYRMHSEYLRKLFLHNDLAEGRFVAGGHPVALSDIRAPVFAVATAWDHVAPWRSVYKLHLLTDTDITFLLTTGGHNAGIVSPPGGVARTYQVMAKGHADRYIDPDAWLATAPKHDGSWWPEWLAWLQAASGTPVAPPGMGAAAAGYAPLADAPGSYVLVP
ncbi:alpha/beta fold hydrolase [Ferrovibrio terrae]|uniref:PHA/PHB synthase family protein n=1 Tax=Ferrovibrio terrae TaxID=2594003 RepID=UPI003137AD18